EARMASSSWRAIAGRGAASIAPSSSASSSLAEGRTPSALAASASADWIPRRGPRGRPAAGPAGSAGGPALPRAGAARRPSRPPLGRAEDGLEAINRVAALPLAEPLHRVVDDDVLGQARGALGGGHLEDPAEVQVQPDQDLIAPGNLGQTLHEELAHQGVIARIRVLPLED